jgi:hypothetical protein
MNFFHFLCTTLAYPEPEPGAGAETSIFRLRLQPKVPASCGYGSTSTTLVATGQEITIVCYFSYKKNVLSPAYQPNLSSIAISTGSGENIKRYITKLL